MKSNTHDILENYKTNNKSLFKQQSILKDTVDGLLRGLLLDRTIVIIEKIMRSKVYGVIADE